jgi:hypothetical protein
MGNGQYGRWTIEQRAVNAEVRNIRRALVASLKQLLDQ